MKKQKIMEKNNLFESIGMKPCKNKFYPPMISSKSFKKKQTRIKKQTPWKATGISIKQYSYMDIFKKYEVPGFDKLDDKTKETEAELQFKKTEKHVQRLINLGYEVQQDYLT